MKEKYCFGIEDVVGHLLITLYKEKMVVNRLSYELIEEAGNILAKKLYNNKIEGIFISSGQSTNIFLNKNSDFLKDHENKYIGITKVYNDTYLDNRFFLYLPYYVRLVYESEELKKEIIDLYKKYNVNNLKQEYQCELEDLVENLLIILKKEGYDVRRLSYRLLDTFGSLFLKKLKEKGFIGKLILSRELKLAFLYKYSDTYKDIDNEYLAIIKDISLEELIPKCYGCMPYDMYKVFEDKDLINKIEKEYIKELDSLNNKEKTKRIVKTK